MGRSPTKRPLAARRTIGVVSGLPRSGTSMMMQMLEAAGLDVAHDAKRAADPDNPRGYYELEAVRRLPIESGFLAAHVGRVVKIVSPLLRHLPAGHDYRVVFLERDLGEVLASQRAMIERRGASVESPPDDEAMRRAFEGQLADVRAWMAGHETLRVLFVPHADVLARPIETGERVLDFLDSFEEAGTLMTRSGARPDRSKAVAAMADVVDGALHRQRQGAIRGRTRDSSRARTSRD